MHVSSNKGYVELVQLLLYHQADQESSTKDGLIPLHTASRFGKDDVVGELLHDRNDLVEYKSKVISIIHYNLLLF